MPLNSFDLPPRDRDNYSIVVYRDAASDFRWRMTNRHNAKIEGAATEGYKNLGDCLVNCWVCTGWLPDDVDVCAIWDDAAAGMQALTEAPG